MITQKELQEHLHYDTGTGIFTWLISPARNVKAGDAAGCIDSRGYIQIKIKGVLYRAHRLAWLYVHGHFPPNGADHKNLTKSDNWISNLRPATDLENQKNTGKQSNNTSGFKGVCWEKQAKKWKARCVVNGKDHYLGLFDVAAEASAVREAFAQRHHGEFYNDSLPKQIENSA